MHLVLFGLILWINRAHTYDLSVVTLDKLTTQSAASAPIRDEDWQRPMLRKTNHAGYERHRQ